MITRLLVAATIIVALICGTCAYEKELESRAPIIETCIKHPATRRILKVNP